MVATIKKSNVQSNLSANHNFVLTFTFHVSFQPAILCVPLQLIMFISVIIHIFIKTNAPTDTSRDPFSSSFYSLHEWY